MTCNANVTAPPSVTSLEKLAPDKLAPDADQLIAILLPDVLRLVEALKAATIYRRRTNEGRVADSRILETLRDNLALAERAKDAFYECWATLRDHHQNYKRRIGDAEAIDEVTPSGLGLTIDEIDYRDGKCVRIAAGPDGRRAEVYPNAHNRGATFGLKTFRDGTGSMFDRERFHGAGWLFEEAVAEARFWVVGGVLPGVKRAP